MAAPAPAQSSAAIPSAPPPQQAGPEDMCPLCGAPLQAAQEWCLRCGAAARTRLAASPNWRTPLVAIALVAVLALGVLAGALVKLAGGSESSAPTRTTTVTSTAAASVLPKTTQTTAGTVPPLSTAGTTPGATSTRSIPNTAATTPTTPTSTGGAKTVIPGLGTARTKLGGRGKSRLRQILKELRERGRLK